MTLQGLVGWMDEVSEAKLVEQNENKLDYKACYSITF